MLSLSVCALSLSPISLLYYLSRFDCAPVVDHEFVIWVSSCSMVVIRWVFGFRRVGCDSVGFWLSSCSMALSCWFHRAQWRDIWVLPCSMVSLCSTFVGFWVSPCWLWSDCDMSFLGFAMFCGAGLAERWVAVWWTFRDERDRDKFIFFYFIIIFFFTILLQCNSTCSCTIAQLQKKNCNTWVWHSLMLSTLGHEMPNSPYIWHLHFPVLMLLCKCGQSYA